MAVNTNPSKPPAIIAIIASNPTTSETTGWPIGFWWEEVTDPYFTFTKAGYEVDIISPGGGALQGDAWSDPRDESGYSASSPTSMRRADPPRWSATRRPSSLSSNGSCSSACLWNRS